MFFIKNQSIFISIFSLLFIVVLFLLPYLAFASHEGGLVPCHGLECGFCDLITLAMNIINWLFIISIPLAAIAFAIAGVIYLTSAGNPGKVAQAHDIFWWVFWGLIIALAAWLIINALAGSLLNKNILTEPFWFIGNDCKV